jgi:hypothetical protein
MTIWKEVVVTEFEALSWSLPGETEEITNIYSHDSRSYRARDLGPGPPEYVEVLLHLGVPSLFS